MISICSWLVLPLVEQELLTLPKRLGSPLVFSGVRGTRSLVLCVCFVDHCLPFCTLSFGYESVDISASVRKYRLNLTMGEELCSYKDSEYHFGIFKLFLIYIMYSCYLEKSYLMMYDFSFCLFDLSIY